MSVRGILIKYLQNYKIVVYYSCQLQKLQNKSFGLCYTNYGLKNCIVMSPNTQKQKKKKNCKISPPLKTFWKLIWDTCLPNALKQFERKFKICLKFSKFFFHYTKTIVGMQCMNVMLLWWQFGT